MKITIKIETEDTRNAVRYLELLIKTLEMANSLSLPFDHLEISDSENSLIAKGE